MLLSHVTVVTCSGTHCVKLEWKTLCLRNPISTSGLVHMLQIIQKKIECRMRLVEEEGLPIEFIQTEFHSLGPHCPENRPFSELFHKGICWMFVEIT